VLRNKPKKMKWL